jgi:hypothetical protein
MYRVYGWRPANNIFLEVWFYCFTVAYRVNIQQRVQQTLSHNLFTTFTVAPEVVYGLMPMTEYVANTTTLPDMLICTTS